MVAPVVVALDEGCDLRFQVPGQIIILQQDAVLEGLVPALDLALGLGMIGRPTDMAHVLLVQPFGQFPRDVTGTIVGQQPGSVPDMGLIAA